MSDVEDLVRVARVTNRLREPALCSAIEALRLPSGSHGLDAGCGVGHQTLMLTEEIGPAGHVTGIDLSNEILSYADVAAREAELSERVTFQRGDVRALPFDDDRFDWAWSADCVGYGPMEPLPVVRELARVVKPGGTVAILAWSHETLLPGHPALEARLKATSAGIAPFVQGEAPSLHFPRALGWFREIGFREPTVQTFAGDTHAPLTAGLRTALTMLFNMRWPEVESELSPADFTEYQRLCLPESPDFILDEPDYYAFFTYSMFRGTVP